LQVSDTLIYLIDIVQVNLTAQGSKSIASACRELPSTSRRFYKPASKLSDFRYQIRNPWSTTGSVNTS
jgi:hypothetical protein